MATRSQERKPASCVPRKTEEDQSRRARYGNFSKAPKHFEEIKKDHEGWTDEEGGLSQL